ncbi:MAG TPA: VWA domain-containing protein, partial [Lysobacter sp.]|nr:VWA domain-containing protein [Lysobacter sp.]
MSAFALPLQFLRPWWLLALFALPLIVRAWRSYQRQRSGWRDVVDPHLLPHLLEGGGKSGRGARAPWLALGVLALAILALAGPSWRQREQPLWQTRAPLVVALDLSSSILANDLPPSRLLQARAKIASLLKERAGGQVGLVAYADEAYTVAPLTDDTANVALFLDALAPDVMPVDGSHAADAIARSEQLLKQAGFTEGEILLLTNAADNDAKSEAANAARAGYRVSVLGLGTSGGAAYRRGDG